ncbi:PREDICTED: uncharacterized protein LOC106106762 [Papilio polytes]|uniref:uncharacterized protein LOC106106762 n=1 Tax=Papilio polytes TaxID=76194 RepID=UPI000676024E|nr:PREDICTED: uncharacterized protein LOC106106762 [Papilio polytes]
MIDSVETECFNSPFEYNSNSQEECSLAINLNDANKNVEKHTQSSSNDKMETGDKMAVDDTIAADDKMATDDKRESNNKMAASDSSDMTSRLFQEMEKLDEGSGSLNLTRPHTLPLSHNVQSTSGGDAARDTKRSSMDLSMEIKKKMSKKITDYFSKKSI